jgi:hypothetical protein
MNQTPHRIDLSTWRSKARPPSTNWTHLIFFITLSYPHLTLSFHFCWFLIVFPLRYPHQSCREGCHGNKWSWPGRLGNAYVIAFVTCRIRIACLLENDDDGARSCSYYVLLISQMGFFNCLEDSPWPPSPYTSSLEFKLYLTKRGKGNFENQ